MGASKVPTETLKRRGSRRAKDRKGEPVPPEGVLESPEMSALAQEKWDYYLLILDKMGVISVAELDSLTTMCRSFAASDLCWEHIDKAVATGNPMALTTLGATGVKEHPILGMQRKFWEQGMKIANKFGLNPSDRANAQVVERAPDDPTARMVQEALGRGN